MKGQIERQTEKTQTDKADRQDKTHRQGSQAGRQTIQKDRFEKTVSLKWKLDT